MASISIGSAGRVSSGGKQLWCPACGNETNWRDITANNQRTHATCGDCGNRISVKN
ncbi:hypothetical protein KBX06_00430 [Micromonospora sp. C31]|uniref:hypothetical protein n=1 Tax=Micromonospora sp. C31 TaxID=2824876 RepID=UPI001B39C8F2|nr:hypothetical protein [Micromonospora sp. C31]MBQ1071638.1 hypothetical protein [Micromonospora sp. C31]